MSKKSIPTQLPKGQRKPTDQAPKVKHKRVVASNRKAFHEYQVEDRIQAGIALTGTEIKSVRASKVNFTDSFARIENNSVFLYHANISIYEQGTYNNHEPRRTRRLLLNRAEIKKLQRKVEEKGYTLIPLSMYILGAWAKVEIGLCRGKKLYDKRETVKQRDGERELRRVVKGVHRL
jgi:SsrA-binding protein